MPKSIIDIKVDTTAPLRQYFVSCVQAAEEGLIIKGSNSKYEPAKRIWYKMKPDFIKGLGDTGEYCILGGSYISKKSKFLDITLDNHPYLLNTFFIGVLLNKKQVINMDVAPDFHILFELEAGFSRELLKDFSYSLLEFRAHPNSSSVSYSYISEPGLNSMDFLFKNPIIVSLKGSSFVKLNGKWILRHPRLIQICGNERSYGDVLSFNELQELGQQSASILEENKSLDLECFIRNLDIKVLSNQANRTSSDGISDNNFDINNSGGRFLKSVSKCVVKRKRNENIKNSTSEKGCPQSVTRKTKSSLDCSEKKAKTLLTSEIDISITLQERFNLLDKINENNSKMELSLSSHENFVSEETNNGPSKATKAYVEEMFKKMTKSSVEFSVIKPLERSRAFNLGKETMSNL